MKFTKLATTIGLTVGSVLFVSNSAQALSFKSNISLTENGEIVNKSIFNDDKDYTDNKNGKNKKSDIDTTKDIFLQSITQEDKNGIDQTFSNFSYVMGVNSFENTEYDGGNTGAASTDYGDNATAPQERMEDTNQDNIAAFLGNNNLNNIIDGEGRTFSMDLMFDSVIREHDSGLDSLFFYERGMNSDLTIQALDESGNLIGNVMRLNRKSKEGSTQKYAGFKINTQEIDNAQRVGSWGVHLEKDLNVTSLKGIRISADSSHAGPDFKVIARKVPEPTTLIGLGSFAALAFLRRRKSK